MESLIRLNDISKKYKNKIILQNVDLTIKPGDSIAFTGHNGSGKTTLLKLIGGFIAYDSGSLQYKQNVRIGYVPEHFPKMAITARQYITRVGVIEGLDKPSLDKISTDLFNDLHMEQMIDTPIKFLSKGTLQKVAAVQAMLTTPDILLLDEPLSGQDADSQKTFIDMVNKMNARGTAIVMSCHEDWLIRFISKRVYKIDNKSLEESQKIEQAVDEYKVLRFRLAGYGDKRMDYSNLAIKDIVMRRDSIDGEELIYVKKEYCNAIIQKMISDGYELRGINSETIY